eukprot:g63142.t1
MSDFCGKRNLRVLDEYRRLTAAAHALDAGLGGNERPAASARAVRAGNHLLRGATRAGATEVQATLAQRNSRVRPGAAQMDCAGGRVIKFAAHAGGHVRVRLPNATSPVRDGAAPAADKGAFAAGVGRKCWRAGSQRFFLS